MRTGRVGEQGEVEVGKEQGREDMGMEELLFQTIIPNRKIWCP